MLWVDPCGDRRSYAILARNFPGKHSTCTRLRKKVEFKARFDRHKTTGFELITEHARRNNEKTTKTETKQY
jgi:hypothetical protein